MLFRQSIIFPLPRQGLRTIALMLIAVARPLVAQQAPIDSVTLGTRIVTLEEAVKMAKASAPQNVAARGAEVTGKAAVRSAVGAFIPSMSASVGAVRPFTGGRNVRVNSNGDVVAVADRWSYSDGYALNVELLNLSRIPNLQAAKASLSAAKEFTVSQDYQTALSVAQLYFNAEAARESEQAAQIQLDQALQSLNAARRRVVAGAATSSDSLTATVQVATARLALLSARNDRRDVNAALTRLIGSPMPVSVQLDDPAILALDTTTVDSAVAVGLASRSPSIAQAQLDVEASKARRQSAKAAYYPTLNAAYSRIGSGPDRFGFGTDQFLYTGQLSFSLSIPIFDQFSRSQQSAVAQVNENNAVATLRDTELQSKQLAVQFLNSLRLGQQQVVMQGASVVAGEENLRVQQQRYDLRLATIVDVLTAQTTLIQARANLITARNVVRLSIAQLQALVGQPLNVLTRPSGVAQ